MARENVLEIHLHFVVNRVDDFSGLFDKLLAGHGLHGQLLDLGDSSLLRLPGSAAPVAVEDATWLDTEQLKLK